MSEELLINVTPNETRVALVENGVVQEVQLERERSSSIVSNIFKGKVSRVLPGMQAAFVEIGLARAGFLHASDIPLLDGEGMELPEDDSANIHSKVHEGKTMLVQVVKAPLGTKGARLTTHLSLSSRYLVYMPQNSHIGVSQRIESEEERQRLRELVTEITQQEESLGQGGFIVRTIAEGASREELCADMLFLQKLWADRTEELSSVKPPSIVYRDIRLALRALRDMSHPNLEKIRVDSRETYEKVIGFTNRYSPELSNRVFLYQGQRPLFDLYSVEDEIQKALHKRVDLKSGGYLIIEQTEAMITVDVNTGTYVGSRNLEETIFKTNLEAASALARQLRLRNLGGIIIVDFIDMADVEHRRQVQRIFEKALEKDRARTSLTGVSELGLIEMTRKRNRESLGQSLCEVCPQCGGRGEIKSAETICLEMFREITRESRQFECEKILVLASQTVIDRLLDEESDNVAELETFIGHPIELQVEALYGQEQYDIIPV